MRNLSADNVFTRFWAVKRMLVHVALIVGFAGRSIGASQMGAVETCAANTRARQQSAAKNHIVNAQRGRCTMKADKFVDWMNVQRVFCHDN